MHGDQKSCPESADELAGSAGIAVTCPAVDRKEDDVKTVGNFPDVLQLAEVEFLLLDRIHINAKVGTVHQPALKILGQETGIPVVQISGMEKPPSVCIHYPGDTAVGTARSPYPDIPVLPAPTFGQPHIRSFPACPIMLQDIFRQDIGDVPLPLPPPQYAAVEMVLMEMAGEHIKRLVRLQHPWHHPRRILPEVEHQDATTRLHNESAMVYISEFHDKKQSEANIGVFPDSSAHVCPIISLVFRQKDKQQRTEDYLYYRPSAQQHHDKPLTTKPLQNPQCTLESGYIVGSWEIIIFKKFLTMKLEEWYSSILAQILNITCQEGHSVYKSFLSMLDKATDNNSTIFSNLPVKSPVIKAESDKVDISIKDDEYRIIIENKINGAQDVHSQLARYIDGSVHGAHYMEKDIYVVYITDGKVPPSEQTWIRRDNNKFIATDYKDDFKQRFVNISRTDICEWLENDVLIICDKDQNKRETVKKALVSFQSGDIEDCNLDMSNNMDKRLSMIIANWEKYIKLRYSNADIAGIITNDSEIEVIFKWSLLQNGNQYEFGCKLEFLGDEKTKIRYGISRGNDIEYFTKDKLEKLFKLFLGIDRNFNRYNKNFRFPENDSKYFAYREDIDLRSCNDYNYRSRSNTISWI